MEKEVNSVYKRLVSDENIYLSIYSINNCNIDEFLLSDEDYIQYTLLKDKFDMENIQKWVNLIRERIIQIIPKDMNSEGDYIKAQVYFNPKKKNIFRPLHTSSLLEQLTILSLLNILIYDIGDNNEIKISEIGKLIPNDFYGNIISNNPKYLFEDWRKQYKKYSSSCNKLRKKYTKSAKYKYEINLDLKNFFPSVNPLALYKYIVSLIPIHYKENKKKCLRKIIEKLIYIEIDNLKEIEEKKYYITCSMGYESFNVNEYLNKVDNDSIFVIGIPQGLLHSWFLGNLFMIIIKNIYKSVFIDSESIFYVDDSVIFTNSKVSIIEDKIKKNMDLSINTTDVYKKNGIYLDEVIKNINNRIRLKIKVLLEDTLKEINDLYPYCYIKLPYVLSVHNVGIKSSISYVVKDNSFNYDIIHRFHTLSFVKENYSHRFNEDLDETLLIKFDYLDSILKKEIENIKEKDKKLLIKFFYANIIQNKDKVSINENYLLDQLNKIEKNDNEILEKYILYSGKDEYEVKLLIDEIDHKLIKKTIEKIKQLGKNNLFLQIIVELIIFNGIQKKELISNRKFITNKRDFLTFRKDGNIDKLVDLCNENLDSIINTKGYNKNNIIAIKFLVEYREFDLENDIKFLIKESRKYYLDLSLIYEKLSKLDRIMFIDTEIREKSYIKKIIGERKINKNFSLINDNYYLKYKSLYLSIKYKLGAYANKFYEVKKTVIIREIGKLYDKNKGLTNFIDSYLPFGKTNFSQVAVYIISYSDEIFRLILNAIVSYLLDINVSEDLNILRSNNNLTYFDLRLISYLRCKNFNLIDFSLHYNDCLKNDYKNNIDYSLLQVLPIFQDNVKDSTKIDILILAHKFVCDLWKNGSKHLYFYTMHNQEHSIVLIGNVIKIINHISMNRLSKEDFYIVFLACYLHDISMVSIPNYDNFENSNLNSDLIYSEFEEDVINNLKTVTSIKESKKILTKYYLKMDNYFENHVRTHHANESANEILQRSDLDFIDLVTREYVSAVSRSHGMQENEVFRVSQESKSRNISINHLKMLLCFADVLDISSDRVSKLLLEQNLENMDATSRFHWISHSITNEFVLENTYEIENDCSTNIDLNSSLIKEIITIKVPVNLNQITRVKDYKCKLNYCEVKSKNEIEISFDKSDLHVCNDCVFVCKWFVLKNKYLCSQIAVVQEYLKSIPNRKLITKIKIKIEPTNENSLSSNQFKYLKDYVEAK